MIVRNEATGAMSTPPEIKRVDLGWFEKCDDSQNELLYLKELLAIDSALQECDNILSEVNLQFKKNQISYLKVVQDINIQ